jgi:HAD superfamily hydrolase (TIGR01450 family)
VEALVLAAGRGSRLEPITDSNPKALLRVAGKALIDRQIEAFLKFGVKKVVVVTGYRSLQIENYLEKKNYPIEIVIVENSEWETTNNMYSFVLGAKYLQNSAFVVNGDICIEDDFLSPFGNDSLSSVGIFENRYLAESMKVLAQGNVVKSISKTLPEGISQGISADIFLFTQADISTLSGEATRYFAESGKKDWFENIVSSCAEDGRILLRTTPLGVSRWVEIDDEQDLRAADNMFFNMAGFLDHDNFYFDLDGTLVLDHQATSCASLVLNRLSELGKSIFLVTNMTSLTVAEIEYLCTVNGFPISAENILTPVRTLENFLIENGFRCPFILGEESLIRHINADRSHSNQSSYDIVVISNDLTMTAEKLSTAANLIKGGTPYILTHPDLVRPTLEGIFPDAGLWGIGLQAMTGVNPISILGKPDVGILGDSPTVNSILIGDRYDSDIALGKRAGMSTGLILTGVTTRKDYEDERMCVDFVLHDLCLSWIEN